MSLGRKTGHVSEDQPIAYSWGEYVDHLVVEVGSLSAISLRLTQLSDAPDDAASIERALRRLRSRGNRDGGEYGRRLLRVFGLPIHVESALRWMGAYHSRFTDLPLSLCFDQLRLWNRPPMSESRARIWLELGLATCALRQDDFTQADVHIRQAGLHERVASTDARIELRLSACYLASKRDRTAVIEPDLATIEPLLQHTDLESDSRWCLTARWLEQRAYPLLHPRDGTEPNLLAARELLERIPTQSVPAFVACKRAGGLAYVHWRMGHREEAIAFARAACEHAGDGGLMRLRIGNLGLLARILDNEEGQSVRERALIAARALGDESLVGRVQRGAK